MNPSVRKLLGSFGHLVWTGLRYTPFGYLPLNPAAVSVRRGPDAQRRWAA